MSESYSSSGDCYNAWVGAAGSSDNDIIYSSGDVSRFNYHTFAVTGANAADVEVSVDGVNWHLAATILADDATTTLAVATIPTGKLGVLRGKFKKVRIRQDGVTDSNAFGAHGIS